MKTGFYFDPIYQRHDTGAHPENAGRLKAMQDHAALQNVLKDCVVRKSIKADLKDMTLVHSQAHIEKVQAAAEGKLRYFTPDTTLSYETYEVALHAVGSVLDAVKEVGENRLDNAFCAVRPPGHHAEYDQVLGFCFFNNIAIAAAFLTKYMGFKRVLIFDFDVHHGNGTQHSFEERKDIFYASIHQDPRTCYPGTGFAHEKGKGAGVGYTLNCPMPPYCNDIHYKEVMYSQLMPVFEEYKPDFILISAGFDAHQDDPLASMNLTESGFNMMTVAIKNLAERYAQGRLVSVLEGGYDYHALVRCVQEHVMLLKEDDTRGADDSQYMI